MFLLASTGCGADEAAPAGCSGDVVALAQETPGQEGRPRVVTVTGGDEAPDVRVVSDDWVATAPAVSPDGAWLVVTRTPNGDYESAGPGPTALWRVALDGSRPHRLSSAPDEAAPDVSPDGRQVAVAARLGERSDPTWRVASVPADGGEPRALTPSTLGPVRATAWSPDGGRVAYLSRPRQASGPAATGVWVVAAEGGEPRWVADVADAFWLDWRDDATLLVGTTSVADGTIEQVDAATGAIERLADDATMPAVTPDGERLYHLVRVPAPSDGVAGESVEWRLAVARLTDAGLEDEALVGDLVTPFLYPYLGMSAGCA